jgi:hypothetical protein
LVVEEKKLGCLSLEHLLCRNPTNPKNWILKMGGNRWRMSLAFVALLTWSLISATPLPSTSWLGQPTRPRWEYREQRVGAFTQKNFFVRGISSGFGCCASARESDKASRCSWIRRELSRIWSFWGVITHGAQAGQRWRYALCTRLAPSSFYQSWWTFATSGSIHFFVKNSSHS